MISPWPRKLTIRIVDQPKHVFFSYRTRVIVLRIRTIGVQAKNSFFSCASRVVFATGLRVGGGERIRRTLAN